MRRACTWGLATLLLAGCDRLFGLTEIRVDARVGDDSFPPGGRFCTQSALEDATFCADFDTPDGDPLSDFSRIDSDNGTRYETDETDWQSEPRSARLAVTFSNDARLSRVLTADSVFDVSFSMRFITSQPAPSFTKVFAFKPNSGAVTPNTINMLHLTSEGALVASTPDGNGGTSYVQVASVGPIPTDSWLVISLQINATSGQARLGVGSLAQSLQLTTPLAPGTREIFLGPHDGQNPTLSGWEILYDDIVVRSTSTQQ